MVMEAGLRQKTSCKVICFQGGPHTVHQAEEGLLVLARRVQGSLEFKVLRLIHPPNVPVPGS